MHRYVLREGVLEKDISVIIRQTQPSVKAILDAIEPKTDGRKVLEELRKTKIRLQEETRADGKAILAAMMDENNENPEAVKINRLFKSLRRKKTSWWSERVMDKTLVDDIVSEELEVGILDAVKSGVETKGYVKEKITVRKAEEKDVPDIIRMVAMGAKEEHGLDILPPPPVVDNIKTNYGRYYLGFVGDTLAGIQALDPHRRVSWISSINRDYELKDVAYMTDGFTLPKYRHLGVASAIMDKIFEDAGKMGITAYSSTETSFMLERMIKKGFSLVGACTTCPKGPGCGGSLVKKDLRAAEKQ